MTCSSAARRLLLLAVVRPWLTRAALAAAAAYCYATGDRLGLLVVLAAAAGRLLTHLAGEATDALNRLGAAIGATADSLTAIEQTADRGADRVDRFAEVLGEALGELVRELRILGDTVEGAAAALGRSTEAANDTADHLDNIADTLTDLLVDRDRLGLHPGHGHGASGGVG